MTRREKNIRELCEQLGERHSGLAQMLGVYATMTHFRKEILGDTEILRHVSKMTQQPPQITT